MLYLAGFLNIFSAYKTVKAIVTASNEIRCWEKNWQKNGTLNMLGETPVEQEYKQT